MAGIYIIPKPVIELTLEAGGSLAPNTTYYFGARYMGSLAGHSALSDQYSITTDSTNKSIRVKVKWDNGGTWDYTSPTMSFWTANTLFYQILWSSIDMTDGAGNWVYNGYGSSPNIAMNFHIRNTTGSSYNALYTSYPSYSISSLFYDYAPEKYLYLASLPTANPHDNFGWNRNEGQAILYTTSTSDTWDTMIATLKSSSFTNYIINGRLNNTFIGYLSIYVNHDIKISAINLTLYYGSIYSTTGFFDRCVIETVSYYTGVGEFMKGISIYKGNNCYLRGGYYRQNYLIDGENNQINSFGAQLGFNANDSSERIYLNCLLLSNGMNNNNNFPSFFR